MRMLGSTRKPLLIFGGCYSNLEATRALLDEAARLGVDPCDVICTGDVVAYCADPQATVDLVRASGIQVIMGNCEEALAAGADDCGCGFEQGSACDRLSAQWYQFAAAHLDRDARRWMAGLPRRLQIDIRDRRLAVIHGGSRQINRFIFRSTPLSVKRQELGWLRCDGVIAGHCGMPFVQLVSGRLWHNAGAIGMPANDGTPRTWYSVLRPTGEGILVESRPLAYAAEAASAKMRARGLTAGYDATLLSGIWPSSDVLPPRERGQQGRPLAPRPLHWRCASEAEKAAPAA